MDACVRLRLPDSHQMERALSIWVPNCISDRSPQLHFSSAPALNNAAVNLVGILRLPKKIVSDG